MAEGIEFPNVPQDIWARILPDRDMSVIDFLKFPLPIISCSPVTDPHKYLSPLSPTITNLWENRWDDQQCLKCVWIVPY